MNPHIFVYGTLLSTAGHPMGARLQGEARLVGAASIQGRLYELGKYPGLVEVADAAERVQGEVHALNSPATSLAWLDAYEGIVPGRQQNQYERVERTAQLASGGELTVWVYLYRRDVTRFQPIAGGRWMPQRT